MLPSRSLVFLILAHVVAKRFGVHGAVLGRQQLHPLARLRQCLLALLRQPHAGLECLQGFFQAEVAVFQPFDERFEFGQRLLEIAGLA